MSLFKDKVLLITGGTGSFGNAVLRRFLNSEVREIRIFSRDEKKQDDMRHELQNPKVKFYIGNIRDRQAVDGVMGGVDYVVQRRCAEAGAELRVFPAWKRCRPMCSEPAMFWSRRSPTACATSSCFRRIRQPIRSTPWGFPKR